MPDDQTPHAPPSRSLTRYDGPRSTAELRDYALLLAVNTMPDGSTRRNDSLPAIFRGNPAAVAFAVEYAKALDVSPITAVIGIHIVDGKPTASAGLISALVRRAGHKIRTWVEGSIAEGNAKGITTITRADDPEFEYRSEWTLDRAVRAGLMRRSDDGRYTAAKNGSAWSTYPENMLKARSVTECARDAAEDAILGVHYTPEELGAEVDEAGDVIYTVTQVPPTAGHAPAPSAPATDPAAQTPTPDTNGGEDPSHVSEGDRLRLASDAREAILAARTLDDLVAVWNGPAIARSKERAESLIDADEQGVETTILALFLRASDAIKAGTPLVGDPTLDDVVEGEIVEEVAAENDTRGEETEEANGSRPAPSTPPTDEDDARANRDDLDKIMAGLHTHYPAAYDAVVAYVNDRQINPRTSEEDAANLIDAITDGSALGSAWRETLDVPPSDLVTRYTTPDPRETARAATRAAKQTGPRS